MSFLFYPTQVLCVNFSVPYTVQGEGPTDEVTGTRGLILRKREEGGQRDGNGQSETAAQVQIQRGQEPDWLQGGGHGDPLQCQAVCVTYSSDQDSCLVRLQQGVRGEMGE